MKIAIVDDEAFYQEQLVSLLTPHYVNEDIHVFSHVDELCRSKHLYDVVLLDIEIDGVDGISFAKTHVKEYPYIIYVTSHGELLFEAFDVNIVGFVIKKNMSEQLLKKVQDVERRINDLASYHIHSGKKDIKLLKKDVLYFRYEDGYIYVKTTKTIHEVNGKSFKKVIAMLDQDFVQIDRNTVIHLRHIEEVHRAGHVVYMSNQDSFKISERNWTLFKKRYNVYVNRV